MGHAPHVSHLYIMHLSPDDVKEAMLGSIWDTCPVVRTVFAMQPVCHNNQQLLNIV